MNVEKVWGARYTLGARYLTKNTVIGINTEEAIVAEFKLRFRHMYEWTEENHGNFVESHYYRLEFQSTEQQCARTKRSVRHRAVWDSVLATCFSSGAELS